MYITSLPLISSDLAMNISYLKNSYLKGAAASAVLTRSFTQEFSGSAGFRTFIYSYVNPTGTAAQYIPFFDCSYALSRTILLSLNFEGVYEKIGNSTRLFIDLTTRL
jgi:hypothetical protein